MCIVSNVGDGFEDLIRRKYPHWIPENEDIFDTKMPKIPAEVSREEFDALKQTVEEMRDMLKSAKRVDEINGTPDCELESKIALLKGIAELVDVSLDDVFNNLSEKKKTTVDSHPV